MEEGFAQRDRSLQLLVQRLEEVTSEAGKEQERLATSLQVVAEGAQRELNSAEGRLLKRLQGVEQHWEVSSGSALGGGELRECTAVPPVTVQCVHWSKTEHIQ